MAQKLTPADVARIAELARLDLSATELDAMAGDLGAIVTFASTVQEIDTSEAGRGAEMAARAASRDDAPAPGLSSADAMRDAPDSWPDPALFRVPRVL